MTLSDTHLMVLNAAAARPDKLVTKHKRLPGASLQKVCAALVKRGLLAELTGVSRDPDVLQVKTELGLTEYAITPAGLAAIGVDDESPYGEDVPKDERAGVDPFLIEGPDNNPPDDAPAAKTRRASALCCSSVHSTIWTMVAGSSLRVGVAFQHSAAPTSGAIRRNPCWSAYGWNQE